MADKDRRWIVATVVRNKDGRAGRIILRDRAYAEVLKHGDVVKLEIDLENGKTLHVFCRVLYTGQRSGTVGLYASPDVVNILSKYATPKDARKFHVLAAVKDVEIPFGESSSTTAT